MGLQPAKRHVIPPAVEGERMRRYSVMLMLLAFVLIGANFAALNPANLLWFGALLLAVLSILLAATAVVMRGLQWHYDRIIEEVRGSTRGSTRVDDEGAEPGASPAPGPVSRSAG
ncbi:MAG: hypothetical protein AAB409_02860 [Gemmatimonadota bacterium]